jgi:hypothetical protein
MEIILVVGLANQKTRERYLRGMKLGLKLSSVENLFVRIGKYNLTV